MSVETVRDTKRARRFGDLVAEVAAGMAALEAAVRALTAVMDTASQSMRDQAAGRLDLDPDWDPDRVVHGRAALDELMERPEPLPWDAVDTHGGRSTESTPESEAPNP